MSVLQDMADWIDPYIGKDGPDLDNMFHDLMDWKNNKFGLFTPYKNGKEFGVSVALPFVAPIVFGIITAVASIIATLAAVAALGCLIVAAGAAIFRNNDLRDSALEFAAIAGGFALIATVGTIIGSLLTAISAPLTAASIVTRSGATVGSFIANRISPEDQGSDDVEPGFLNSARFM